MYDSEPISLLIEDIYSTVSHFAEDYLESTDAEEREASGFDKEDVIIIYKKDNNLIYDVEHFRNFLIINSGEAVLCQLDKLLTDSPSRLEPDWDKIKEVVYAIAIQDIPRAIIDKADELSRKHYFSGYSLSIHHSNSDGTIYYLCVLNNGGLDCIIKAQGENVNVYNDIKPFAHSVIPDQVLDFLYPDEHEYTHIRYIGTYKHESLYYPCHEDSILADGYVIGVNVLVAYDDQNNSCRYIRGELANRLYCRLDK